MTDVLDKDELLERIDRDMEFLAETRDMFDEDQSLLLTEIREAIERGDHKAVATATHTFKGMVGNFCAVAAAEAAAGLEAMAKAGDLTKADEALAGLENEIARLQTALSEILNGG